MRYDHPNPELKLIQPGLIDFKDAWDLQEKLFAELVELKLANRELEKPVAIPNYLIVCQHPPVFTLGKSGTLANLLASEDRLAALGASFYQINRGGDITHHGPGQLVVYPILDLENFFTDIHMYLRTLEETVIQTLAEFGISAGRFAGYTGVWIDPDGNNPRKICAMGVKCSRWITMHGLALNINNDLSFFNHIIPCGIKEKSVTNMVSEAPDRNITLEHVTARFLVHFTEIFKGKLIGN
jgi:lipoyl(octanoyl) transferase